jgi:hypothetical protein
MNPESLRYTENYHPGAGKADRGLEGIFVKVNTTAVTFTVAYAGAPSSIPDSEAIFWL